MLDKKNIKLVRKLNWEEVFAFWYDSEGKRENWIELAKKRGFASWAEWRLNVYAIPFECRNADWGLYEISEPAKVVSGFYGGPFRSWVEKYYNGRETIKFEELVKILEIKEHETIMQMSKDFPIDKVITCLLVKDDIFVIEGMHRSCALALLDQEGKDLNKKILFAIGKSELNSLPIVGRVDKK